MYDIKEPAVALASSTRTNTFLPIENAVNTVAKPWFEMGPYNWNILTSFTSHVPTAAEVLFCKKTATLFVAAGVGPTIITEAALQSAKPAALAWLFSKERNRQTAKKNTN